MMSMKMMSMKMSRGEYSTALLKVDSILQEDA